MRDENLDGALSSAVREGMGLSGAEQEALWERFAARVRGEAYAWAFFMSAMMRANARIRPTSIRSSWANRRQH